MIKISKLKFKMVLAVFLMAVAVGTIPQVSATVVNDEPEITATLTSNMVPAGQTYPLQVSVMNTAKYEWVERGTPEEEIAYNNSLKAYNVSIWLEGKELDVKSGKARIPMLSPGKVQNLNFLISVPAEAKGKYDMTLHVKYEKLRSVNVRGNISASYDVNFYYREVTKEIPVELEVVEKSTPVIKVIPVRTTFYESEVNQFTLQVVNEGTGTARNVKVQLDGVEVLDPQTGYVSSLPPSAARPVTFNIRDDKGSYEVSADLNFSYFDGEKWVSTTQEDEFVLDIDSLNKGIVISHGENEYEREQEGFMDLYVMNSFNNPVSSLKLELNEPQGVDLELESLLLGYLNPGQVRKAQIPYEVDEEADFGSRNILVNGSFQLMSSYPTEGKINSIIPFYIKPQPEFKGWINDTAYIGDNLIEVNLQNNGGTARDIHAVIKPSPGITVKTPDAFVKQLKNNETASIRFKVNVDEDVIPNSTYRMEMKVTSEDYKGDDVTEDVYVYLPVEERFNYTILVIPLAIIVIALVALKKRRESKG